MALLGDLNQEMVIASIKDHCGDTDMDVVIVREEKEDTISVRARGESVEIPRMYWAGFNFPSLAAARIGQFVAQALKEKEAAHV